jgi:hypothetical protein
VAVEVCELAEAVFVDADRGAGRGPLRVVAGVGEEDEGRMIGEVGVHHLAEHACALAVIDDRKVGLLCCEAVELFAGCEGTHGVEFDDEDALHEAVHATVDRLRGTLEEMGDGGRGEPVRDTGDGVVKAEVVDEVVDASLECGRMLHEPLSRAVGLARWLPPEMA